MHRPIYATIISFLKYTLKYLNGYINTYIDRQGETITHQCNCPVRLVKMTATTAEMIFADRSSLVPLLEASQRKKIKDRSETAKAAQLKILMTR